MKYETTPAFDADFKRLKPEHRAAFRLGTVDDDVRCRWRLSQWA
jgi:hypothetical protein